MKKSILLAILLLSAIFYAQENRELNIGVNAGLPIDISKNYASVAFGIEANYLFDDLLDNFKIGPSIGLAYFSPKEVDGKKPDAVMFLPIAVSMRFQNFEDSFYAGIDLGYGLGLAPDTIESGLYLKPAVGVHLGDAFKMNLFYMGITDEKDGANSYIGLGLEFNFLATESSRYSY